MIQYEEMQRRASLIASFNFNIEALDFQIGLNHLCSMVSL